MKTLTLQVPDKKYPFFKELVKNLGFVKEVVTDDEPTKEQILAGIREAVEEMKLIKSGKLKGRNAEDLFNDSFDKKHSAHKTRNKRHQ